MGKWSDFSGVMLTPEMFEDAISDILEEYGDVVYNMTEEGLTKAEKVLIKNLKVASPKKTGKFAKNWKGKGKKYKLRRFVGNTTVVEGKSGDIALANIFEYSTTRGKPFIKATFEKSVPEMAQVIVDEIKKGV
ncbi:hypothetical protein [Gudongella sp. SC589]|uniref:hypothetical protein n=1 Tax=Gudongella sp. SC589 TaxID=3385990 RepID=UPI0039048017